MDDIELEEDDRGHLQAKCQGARVMFPVHDIALEREVHMYSIRHEQK